MATYSGVDAILMLGTSSPSPAPADITAAVRSIDVLQDDSGQSGFQIVFHAGKNSSSSQGYPIVGNSLLLPFNRVVIQVNLYGTVTVLMDGVITHLQLSAGNEPEGAIYTVTGEDIGVMLNLQERIADYPAMDEASIAQQILGQYSSYGLQAQVTTPDPVDKPAPNDYVPVQHSTDWQYLSRLAERLGFIFYIQPGSSAGTNIAYWGPPVIDSTPQKAITADLGPGTNVLGAPLFEYDALAAATVTGLVQDRETDVVSDPDITADDSERPALTANPAVTAQAQVRTLLLDLGEGRTSSEATAYAQGVVDERSGRVMRLSGVLDGIRYGSVLKTRALVDVRGGGVMYDGKYYVNRVLHRLNRQSYQQKFAITREGWGAAEQTVQV